MDAHDTTRLSKKYEDGDPLARRLRLWQELGVEGTAILALRDDVAKDRDLVHKGLRTLASLDFRRRVLISDLIVQACDSTLTNSVDASLHALELRAALAESSRQKEYQLQPTAQGLPALMTPTRTPLEDVRERMVEVHVAGFFRAVASTLDCLGIAAIGILGLQAKILRGDMGKLPQIAKHLAAVATKGAGLSPAQAWQQRHIQAVLAAIDDAGPVDWAQWASDMRNMYVHRPRRFVLNQATPRAMALVHPSGFPFMQTDFVDLLPRDPGRSDIDVFVDVARAELLALHEHPDTTIAGILASLVKATGGVCAALGTAWADRVANPSLIEQPAAQWTAADSESRCSFTGYRPGSFPVRVHALQIPASEESRFRAAGVLDTDRHLWQCAPPF